MVTGMRLELRQHQSLVLTPQLQQAIRLLQMSNVELAGAVDKEVAENPFLSAATAKRRPGGGPGTAADACARGPGPIERDDGWWQPPAGRAADCALAPRADPGRQAFDDDLPSLEARLDPPRRAARAPDRAALASCASRSGAPSPHTLVESVDDDGYLRRATRCWRSALRQPRPGGWLGAARAASAASRPGRRPRSGRVPGPAAGRAGPPRPGDGRPAAQPRRCWRGPTSAS